MQIRCALFFSLFLFQSSTFAGSLVLCRGQNQTHTLLLEKIGRDLEIHIENRQLVPYEKIGNDKEGYYSTSGKEHSTLRIKNIDIDTYRKSRTLSQESVVALLLGRPDFAGEEDLIYSHARNLLSSLKCSSTKTN